MKYDDIKIDEYGLKWRILGLRRQYMENKRCNLKEENEKINLNYMSILFKDKIKQIIKEVLYNSPINYSVSNMLNEEWGMYRREVDEWMKFEFSYQELSDRVVQHMDYVLSSFNSNKVIVPVYRWIRQESKAGIIRV